LTSALVASRRPFLIFLGVWWGALVDLALVVDGRKQRSRGDCGCCRAAKNGSREGQQVEGQVPPHKKCRSIEKNEVDSRRGNGHLRRGLLATHAADFAEIFAQRLANGLRRLVSSIAELLHFGCHRTAAILLLKGIQPAAAAGEQCGADGWREQGQTDG
jgi:hypothetical protein